MENTDKARDKVFRFVHLVKQRSMTLRTALNKQSNNSFIIQFFGRDCQSWHGITFAHCARAIMVRPLLLHIHVVRFACKTKKVTRMCGELQ